MPAARHFAPIDFRSRYRALDGVRALAILMVFVDHFRGGARDGAVLRIVNSVGARGGMGVDLFFVLSGFLITGILYDTRTDSHFFQRFFARRSLRILPVFFVVVVLLLLLTPILHYQWHWAHLSFLFYVGNFFANYHPDLWIIKSANHPAASVTVGHFWSLCVEEQFYLLWPIAVWFIRDRVRLIRLALGLSVVAFALRVAMIVSFSPNTAQNWIIRTLPFRMDALLFGGILALLLRGPAADRYQRSAKWVFLAASAGAIAACWYPVKGDLPWNCSPWYLSVGITFIALASAGLIGSALRIGGPAYRFLSLKPLRILGKYSYGFYIYHLLFLSGETPYLNFLERHLHSRGMAGIIVVATYFTATFIVSKVSYDYFESRFLHYKDHFEYDSEHAVQTHA